MRIISLGSLRMRGDISVYSQRETDYYILFYSPSNGGHLRSVLEMSICPPASTTRREILRWVGVRERNLSTILLASSFFAPRLEWIAAVTDDRNNWIGCLKHAHFKRTTEWILETRVSDCDRKIRFRSMHYEIALQNIHINKFLIMQKILGNVFNNMSRKSKRDTTFLALLQLHSDKKNEGRCNNCFRKIFHKKLYNLFLEIYYNIIYHILK